LLVEELPAFDNICSSVPEPIASPGLASVNDPAAVVAVPQRTLAVPEVGAGKYVVEAVVLENAAAAVVPKSYVQGCALATNASITNAHVQSDLKGFIEWNLVN
jgi:hypothetical protein